MTVVALVGCGYWGPNLLRTLHSMSDVDVRWVAEPSPVRRDYVTHEYPRQRVSVSADEVFNDPAVDAVIIATPAATHAELVAKGLAAGKHVLVEKPLALSIADARKLTALAKKAGRTLMVGHTFVYNPAVRQLKQLLLDDELGEPYYAYAQRLNLGQVRADVNAWWNLAPHDVSVLLYLFDQRMPEWVAATGVAHLQPDMEDVVFASLSWTGGLLANIHVSWLDPGKVRRLTIVGSKKMAVYDDQAEHKLAVVDKGVEAVPRLGERMDYDQPQLRLRAGAVYWPEISPDEPLKLELIDFIECLGSDREPVAAASTGIDVVTVLEAGQRSLKGGGHPVFLAD